MLSGLPDSDRGNMTSAHLSSPWAAGNPQGACSGPGAALFGHRWQILIRRRQRQIRRHQPALAASMAIVANLAAFGTAVWNSAKFCPFEHSKRRESLKSFHSTHTFRKGNFADRAHQLTKRVCSVPAEIKLAAMGKTRGHGTRKGGAASGRSRGGRGWRPATDAAASDYSGSESEEEKVVKTKVKREGEKL